MLTGEHLIFYTQKRIGRGGNTFGLIKFVTMLKNSPNIGSGDVTLKNDSRVLPIGRFLRSSKINELPQLVNILLGDMSFVGPRPLTPNIFKLYSQETKLFIVKMKPGLTGVGSIIFRDEESIINNSKLDWEECIKTEIMPKKAHLEKWYYLNQGFFLDILLILITTWAVFFPNRNLIRKIFKDLPN